MRWRDGVKAGWGKKGWLTEGPFSQEWDIKSEKRKAREWDYWRRAPRTVAEAGRRGW